MIRTVAPRRPGRILLCQLPVPAVGPGGATGNTFLAGATLAIHTQRALGLSCPRILLLPDVARNRGGDAFVVESISAEEPDAVGFTCASWNIERTMLVAARLRERLPSVRVWLGGPEIAADAPCAALRDAPFECAVEGEGEGAFAMLAAGVRPQGIAGLLLPGARRTTGKRRPPLLTSLDQVHDPYVAGLITPESDGVVLVETMRGCSCRCSYCRYSQGLGARRIMRSDKNVTEVFLWAYAHGGREVYLLDPCLEQRPGLPRFLERLAVVNRGRRLSVFAELRAEQIDYDRARQFARAGVRAVECGLQTLTPAAMRLAHRWVNKAEFTAGVEALRKAGICVTVDLIAGLPGDTPDGFRRTVAFVRNVGLADRCQVFRAQALPGTELRSRAPSLGVAFEPGPPHFVLSTPTWPGSELEGALAEAEEVLGFSHKPEDRPCLPEPRPGTRRFSLGLGGPVWCVACDLAVPAGRKALAAEQFRETATPFTLWLALRDPVADIASVCLAARCCLNANPFAALCIVLDFPVHAPLDIFDAVREVFRVRPGCSYSRRMYSSLGLEDPLRRVFACLPLAAVADVNRAWLRDLRDVAEVVWWCGQSDAPSQLARALGHDFVLVDPAHTERLPSGIDPDRIIVPGPERYTCGDLTTTPTQPQGAGADPVPINMPADPRRRCQQRMVTGDE